MKITQIHPWQCDYTEAVAIQNELREKLILRDDHLYDPIRTIAGADIGYAKESTIFFGAVILLDYESMEILEESTCIAEVSFPFDL
jgi:deoxyribonuclease V